MESILNNFKNISIRERKSEIKVGVIAGGMSSEREVSLQTGREIYNSLLKSGYKTSFIDLRDDFLSKLQLIDMAFLALHGRYGEDGTVQGMLEILKIPYTGSGVLSSAMAMDKIISKKIFKYECIPTPDFMILDNTDNETNWEKINARIKEKLSYPVVIKPNSEGSTIGISIVKRESELASALKLAYKYGSKILVEKFIKGRLLTVTILGNKPFALPIIEIRPKSGFYDYQSKYTSGLTEYIVPAKLEENVHKHICRLALKSHFSLQCCGLSRVDLILAKDNIPYILEVNTMPGMTSVSLVPKAAKSAGIDFDLLVEIILDMAGLKT